MEDQFERLINVSLEGGFVTIRSFSLSPRSPRRLLGADIIQVRTSSPLRGKTYKWYVLACNNFGATNLPCASSP